MVTSPAQPRALRSLLIVALVGFAWWFFGNLYEAIVISPNWVVDSPAQLTRLHEFFTVSGPTFYFVPVTLIGMGVFWVALYVGREVFPVRTRVVAIVVSVALSALTVTIVSVLVDGLFGDDYLAHAGQLNAYAWWWNIANVVRMTLTAACAVLTWRLLHPRPSGARVAA